MDSCNRYNCISKEIFLAWPVNKPKTKLVGYVKVGEKQKNI